MKNPKETCSNYNDRRCGKIVEGEICGMCCVNCDHAVEMDCTFVCPGAAEYHHPEES